MSNLVPIKSKPEWLKTPLLSKSLDSRAFDKHRATVAFELEVLAKKVDRFGWDRDRETPAQDRLITDWMDALADFTLEEVKAACKQAILDNPNKCPNEGHVRRIIEKRRDAIAARFKEYTPPEEPKPAGTADSSAAIFKEVGFNPRRFK